MRYITSMDLAAKRRRAVVTCARCRRHKALHARGMCSRCYKIVRACEDRGVQPPAPPGDDPPRPRRRTPESPTAALPGTEEKIRVLSERYVRGEKLWHPEDARRATT